MAPLHAQLISSFCFPVLPFSRTARSLVWENFSNLCRSFHLIRSYLVTNRNLATILAMMSAFRHKRNQSFDLETEWLGYLHPLGQISSWHFSKRLNASSYDCIQCLGIVFKKQRQIFYSSWKIEEREREREKEDTVRFYTVDEIDFQGTRGNLRKFTIREQLTRARVNPPRPRRVERGEPSRWQTLSISRWPETTTLVPSSSSFYIVPTIKPTAGRARSVLFLTPHQSTLLNSISLDSLFFLLLFLSFN